MIKMVTGNDYYDYADKTNPCKDDCDCTATSCSDPTISVNSPLCIECQNDDDCNALDQDYCSLDLVKHDEGQCVNFECSSATSTTQNCNDFDANRCDGTQIKHDDYICSGASCVLNNTTLVQECNDNKYCTGDESCSNASCVPGTAINCTGYDLASIASCTHTPDGNSFTWDYFGGFTSSCDENNDACLTGTISLTHTCDT
ncbi:hypothetical protein HZC32_02965, partial [Candidatus Woesearchaeota archaeon]|nr:hypothetical protein [Candidatus Woesearchaeota archaeon]